MMLGTAIPIHLPTKFTIMFKKAGRYAQSCAEQCHMARKISVVMVINPTMCIYVDATLQLLGSSPPPQGSFFEPCLPISPDDLLQLV